MQVIIFVEKLEERTELFSIYHNLDKEIIREASKNDLYLIGGTAIEIWLNYLAIKGWRKRSNNDLDFLINKASSDDLYEFEDFLEDKGFERVDHLSFKLKNKIKIDFLDYKQTSLRDDEYLLKSNMFRMINSIKLMSPVFLFTSKLSRAVYLIDSKIKDIKGKARLNRDLRDLKDLLKIIKKLKLENETEKSLEYFLGSYQNKFQYYENFINEKLK